MGAGSPSRRGYVIAVVIAVIGVVIGVSGLLRGLSQLSDRVEAFQRVDVPGTDTLSFSGPGDFTVYYEATSLGLAEGETVSLPAVDISLESEGDKASVELAKYSGNLTYTVGGYEGVAVATFHIDRPGTYKMTAKAALAPGIGQLAVGKGLGSSFARALLPGLILLLALLTAIILTVVTAVRRHRARGQ